MATNYRVVHTGAGPFRRGDVVSKDHIDAVQGLGGVERLLRKKAVEETSDAVTWKVRKVTDPNVTKGDNVEAGDTAEARAERRAKAVGDENDGTQHAAAGSSDAPPAPRTEAGKVTRTSTAPAKKSSDDAR